MGFVGVPANVIFKKIQQKKLDAMTYDEAAQRITHIWNYPGLKTMSEADHEKLALELREIASRHGIGGEDVFREMCEEIRRKRA